MMMSKIGQLCNKKKPPCAQGRLTYIEPRRVYFSKVKSAFLLTLCGAENEARTRDPNLGKVVLYQLSYFRMSLETVFVSFGIAKVRIIFNSPNFFVKNIEKLSIF